MISARTYSDDRVYRIDFDATPWFEQASPAERRALRDCGWGGDYPADRVAEWFDAAGTVPEIYDMFRYIENQMGKPGETGFECRVDEDEAVAWLEQHRPGWQRPATGDRPATGRYDKIDRCQCGAHTTHGCGKGQPGHSDYCPWRA